jgi:preprotein translocase subunit YajC
MTIMENLLILAQASGGGMFGMVVPMILVFGILYFMMIRPQQRKEKERREMIVNLKSGTRVIFGGGIVGTVTNVKDSTFVVKIADNVKVEVLRGAVSRIVEKGDKLTDEDEK